MQCLETTLGAETYFAIILFVTGAVMNGVKRIKFVPGDSIPVLAFMFGWSIDSAMSNLSCGMNYTEAALTGLGGGLAGLGAAGGHEALSRAASVFGFDKLGAKLLGKAKAVQDKRKGVGAALLVLFIPMIGCGGVLGTAAKAAHVVGNALEILDSAAAGAEKYLARHPSLEKEEAVAEAIKLVREAVDGGQKEKAVKLYEDMRTLLDESGIMSASPPDGGAETDAPEPEPFTLPTGEEFGATL